MIPKIIHYCWFGEAEKSELINRCFNSWKQYLPEYEFVLWNESNFDVNLNPFVLEAYNLKKWAFVTDYVRLHVLYIYGGIYLDTDIEITKSFDLFLCDEFFIGLEMKGFISTAVIGASKGNTNIKMFFDYYTNRKFSQIPNPQIFTPLLKEKYSVTLEDDVLYLLEDKVKVYPSNYFCVAIPENYAIHHFEGSWLDDIREYKAELTRIYHVNQIINYKNNISDLFSALINHDAHIKNIIIEASTVIIKKEKDNVFSELEFKNQYIAEIELELKSKNQYIAETELELASKNQYIAETELELASKNQYIAETELELASKYLYISNLEFKIRRIKKTFFYKTLVKIEFLIRSI
jgi:hypothetical protein